MTPLVLAAALAATFTVADNAPQIAAVGKNASRNMANSLIPTSFGRDSDEMRALNAAPSIKA
jgi:hypothetical protein